MARYQERFQGKKQVFLIRNGEAADAPAVMRYMSQVNRETTFLSMEAGEFEKVFSLEKETQLLAEWAPSQYHLSLLAQTEAGGNRRKLQLFLLHREAAVPPPGQPGPLRAPGLLAAGPGEAAAGDSGGVVPQPGHHQAVPGGGHQQHPSPGAVLANGI